MAGRPGVRAPPQARVQPAGARGAELPRPSRLVPALPLLAAALAAGTSAAAALDGPWAATALAGALLAGAAVLRGYLMLPLAAVALAAGGAGYARYVEAQRAPPPA